MCGLSADACSLVTDLSDIGGDASTIDANAETPIPDDGFKLIASPAHVTQDPMDAVDITIAIQRGAQFTDIVEITVNDLKLSGVNTSPQTLTIVGTDPVTLHVDTTASAKTGQDGTVGLLGVGKTTQKTATASFGMRIGSVLVATNTSTTLNVPPYAQTLTIKVWGAGGAGGASVYDSYNSIWGTAGLGGAGALASATFDVKGVTSLSLVVGTPGLAEKFGGGGGGYSAVMNGSDTWIVAGGGGGGSSGGLTSGTFTR